MQPMRAISVTICRDRRPDSPIAPRTPLPADEWQRFRADVQAAMEGYVPSPEDTEIRHGRTVYAGLPEDCVTYSRIWAEPTEQQMAALRARLAELAVVLHIERRELVTA